MYLCLHENDIHHNSMYEQTIYYTLDISYCDMIMIQAPKLMSFIIGNITIIEPQ